MYKTVKDTLDTHGMAVKWNALSPHGTGTGSVNRRLASFVSAQCTCAYKYTFSAKVKGHFATRACVVFLFDESSCNAQLRVYRNREDG